MIYYNMIYIEPTHQIPVVGEAGHRAIHNMV